ncbi:MAG: S26 family signal peptidase, partial [Thermoplasmata archaeon]
GHPFVKDYEGQKWIKISEDYIIIYNCSYNGRNLIVNITGMKNEDGFITVGDHNLATSPFYDKKYGAYLAADQNIFGYPPVSNSSVEGIAFGNIPWFGLIKLNFMELYGAWPYYNEVPEYSYDYLAITIIILIGISESANYAFKKMKK